MNLEQAALDQFKKRGPKAKMSEGDKQNAAEAVEAGEVAGEVLENSKTQRAFNKLVEKLDDSAVIKPFKAAWEALPAWAQEGYIHPVARGAMGVSIPGVTAMWFDKMVKCGLLKMKKQEGAKEVSLEERKAAEEKMQKFAGEAGKIATGGEASGLIDMVMRVVKAQENLMQGARKNLEKVHAEKEQEQRLEALESADRAVSKQHIKTLRAGIKITGKKPS